MVSELWRYFRMVCILWIQNPDLDSLGTFTENRFNSVGPILFSCHLYFSLDKYKISKQYDATTTQNFI